MILHQLRHRGTHAFPAAEISIDFEQLPHVTDPLESLFPAHPRA